MKLSQPGQLRLAGYLLGLRLSSGKTQADLSKRLKLKSPQYISNVERGACAVSVQALAVYKSLLPACNRVGFNRFVTWVFEKDFYAQLEKL